MAKKMNATDDNTKAPGRPMGGGERYDIFTVSEANVSPSQCVCGSVERSQYFGITTAEFDGQRIIRKRTACLICGQHRIDRFIENIRRDKND